LTGQEYLTYEEDAWIESMAGNDSEGESEDRRESQSSGERVSIGAAPGGDRAHLLELMGNQRRRRLVSLLWEQDGEWTIDELATRLASAESDATPDTLAEETLETFRIELYHTHLPKLAEFGVVEYDRSTEQPRVTPAGDGQVREVVDRTLTSLEDGRVDAWSNLHDRYES
jgi:hypothetical protein